MPSLSASASPAPTRPSSSSRPRRPRLRRFFAPRSVSAASRSDVAASLRSLDLLVLHQRLGRALAVHPRVGLPRGLERGAQVVAQLVVLDDPLDVRVRADGVPRCHGPCSGLRGLLLRCHLSPRIGVGPQFHLLWPGCVLRKRAPRGARFARGGSSAASSTSSTLSTSTNFKRLRRCSGISSIFWLVSTGDDQPLDVRALRGERLLLEAADRQHLASQGDLAGHRRVGASTGRPVMREAIAAAIVMPALGPSLGTAPAGTCTCTSWLRNQSSGRSPSSALALALT